MIRRLVALSAPLLALALSGPSQAQPPARPLVASDAGALQGVETEAIRAFKGIPYAQAPVGALRWRAPQPAARWNGSSALPPPSTAAAR